MLQSDYQIPLQNSYFSKVSICILYENNKIEVRHKHAFINGFFIYLIKN